MAAPSAPVVRGPFNTGGLLLTELCARSLSLLLWFPEPPFPQKPVASTLLGSPDRELLPESACPVPLG